MCRMNEWVQEGRVATREKKMEKGNSEKDLVDKVLG